MKIEKFVKPLYKNKDSMHNFKHILRIKKRVSFLRKNYKDIDENKLKFLIYFHGQKDWVNKNKKKILSWGYPKKYIISLNRHTKNPKLIEEKLVSDANLLEAIGKFGIKKSLQVGKERERTKEETIDFMGKNIKKVKFYTIKGKKIGNKGIEIIKDFLKLRKKDK